MLQRTKEGKAKGQMTFISNLFIVEKDNAYFKEDGLTAELHLHVASYSVPKQYLTPY